MRGITASVYLLAMTILGLRIGPYAVGVMSDASGDLRGWIQTLNVVAVPIALLMLLIAFRARRDETALLQRAT